MYAIYYDDEMLPTDQTASLARVVSTFWLCKKVKDFTNKLSNNRLQVSNFILKVLILALFNEQIFSESCFECVLMDGCKNANTCT